MIKMPNIGSAAHTIAVIAVIVLTNQCAIAGGGPENVFIVANSADANSMTIANHFADYRKIPSGLLFEVDWPEAPHDTTLEEFKGRVLQPVLKAIKDRGLEQQVDYIVYSSGFPYRVNIEQKHPTAKKDWASITSLTYLSDLVMTGKLQTVQSPTANSYARKLGSKEAVVTRAFNRRYPLDMMGDRTKSAGEFGRRYYLSTMLAYTKGPMGNSLTEVLRYLLNAEKADGTKPKGTVYFVKHGDIRSSVRHDHFPSVIEQLKQEGVKGVELQGSRDPVNVLPRNKPDVIGAVIGYAKARWEDSGSRFLPGAIIDNFTSYGGRLGGGHTQVPLTHFLKFGAVASSGTVTEPFAILPKFPHPRMHVHYARGCSVAEAFYQSVPRPYQLIIVGDPLCQPWATPPEVKIAGVNSKKQLSGVIEFKAEAKSKTGKKIRSLELYVDGNFVKRFVPDEPMTFDTSRVSDGFHELRVVAVEDTPIETRGRAMVKFVSANVPQAVSNSEQKTRQNVQIELRGSVVPKDGFISARPSRSPPYVSVSSPGAREIRLYKGYELIGTCQGASGRIPVKAKELGGGPVSLQPVAFPTDRSRKPVLGSPIDVMVDIVR